MSTPSNPSWRYGVYVFPLVPLLSATSYVGSRAMLSTMNDELWRFLAGFVLSVLGQWLAVVFAVVVLAAVVLDARALATRGAWTPNTFVYGFAGLVHLFGAVLWMAYLLSVPALGYYVYRRRQHSG
ncbi:hypothetical protein [Halogranum rubrum]|uniref:Uncharacterized protein n=1 Tax=Halogranum salarium B-1 TaxID=1210908 RepID=J3EX70_9EURY|nr:hypothetical protein [Halogranum salarium]EJN59637.1 hypothetical protein HSB1_17950 [Halogranum salarium B-1]